MRTENNTVTNTYDKLGRVTKTEDAEGNTKQYEYNSLNFVTRQTDEGGDITDYGCSVWGEQTYRKEYNEGGSGEQVWKITYNDFGEITEEEKNDGSIWMYEYDERGLVIGKTEPNGTEASYTYDACGRVTKETRTAENSTRTETKSYSYDRNGFMLSATDNGVTTTYNGGTSNAYGLITQSRTTAGGKTLVTSYAYDKGLRVKEIAYPDARTVSYGYNGTGFLESIGSDGNTTAYAESGTYNSAGQLTSLKAGNGKVTTRTWGSTTGLLDSYSWGLPEYNKRTLAWDNRGNITSIVKGTSSSPYTDSYTYDMKNRLTSETSGAKVRKGSSILTNASYRYAANDVSGKADGAFSSETVRLDYNASSVIIDLGSDMEVNQVNIYGRNSRISPEYLELWTKKAGSESWEKAEDESLNWNQTAEGWTVYFTGGITAKKVKLHSTWDERDADYSAVDKSTFSAPAGNIFEVMFTANGKTNFWTYDAKGNRLTENETTGGIYTSRQEITYYPNTDLIKQYGEWYFNYDRNGSLTARGNTAEEKPSSEEENLFASWIFNATAGEVWYYEYDMSGRMTGSGSSKKGTSGLTERATYAYDYRGLLVRKTYSDFTAGEGVSITGGSTATVTEWYEYNQNGHLLYTEKSDGTAKTDYIWAESTLWCEVDDGKVYWHHTDHLGTTEAVTDETGRVVWSAEYEAFGSVLSENGSMTFTPSFTGKMLDECSGLYYFNARWYDSESGRFTTPDPSRDGYNWYAYCSNNPLIFLDSDGLFAVTAFLVKTAIGAATGAVIGFATNVVVQVGSNVIEQATTGKEINIIDAVMNIDMKSAGAATLSGAVSGAITGGAKAVTDIATAVYTSKVANAVLNTTANMVGTTTGTVVDNIAHNNNMTDGLGLNLAISAAAGVISGATSKTGINVLDQQKNIDSVYFAETIDQAGIITTITNVAPNEIGKDVGVSIGQELAGSVSNSIKGK